MLIMLTSLESIITAVILYMIIPALVGAIIVAFITWIVKLVWRGRNNR